MGSNPLPSTTPQKPDFQVVGIGASAGGLEAFTELLVHLPGDTGLAFVLIQHLDPGHRSLLAEILAPKTPMPVVEATEGLLVSPDSVYVAPPASDVRIEDGVLKLSPRPSAGPHLPIDSFLASLADDLKSKAVAVILSGTAADGAHGVMAVKAAGGVTFAQDPATARHPGMPESAIATGAVDFILPGAEIAAELAGIAGPAGPLPLAPTERVAPRASVEDPVLADLLSLVRSATTVDFTHYKRGTLQRRIGRRMGFRHLSGLEEYVQVLRKDPAEVMALYQDLLIRVTSFFRQPHVFETLKQTVFPRIAEAREGEQVRFWVPGCATGEEAYSLAIAWAEAIGIPAEGKKSLQVFATDISQPSIDTARLGVYPEGIAADVSAERLGRYFKAVEGGYRVSEEIRESCVFARHDLTRDPPFSRLDLISLRNVLIYLGPLLQRRVLPSLHFALRPGGFLLLGEAESVNGFTDLFSSLDKKAKIFTRREASPLIPPAPKPATPQSAAATSPAPVPPAPFDLAREVERVLLESYAPAGVIVDADLQIREYRGNVEPYLRFTPGRASFDLVRMARNGLAGELRTALKEAGTHGAPVHRRGIRLLRDDQVSAVGFDVLPIKSPSGETVFLVLFLDMSSDEETRSARRPHRGPEPALAPPGGVEALERELSEMREYARAVLEDKESANEELRSANEELQSANEELQSVNEELETTSEEVQSANEELRTVNEELVSANEQRSKANEDLEANNACLTELNSALESNKNELLRAWDYAQAVVDAVREPLIVLGPGARVVSASAAFFNLFGTRAADTIGQDFFRLDGGQWEIPALREAVTQALAGNRRFEHLVAEQDFARLGHRTMLLSGSRFQSDAEGPPTVLLAIDDVTERARVESLGHSLERIGLGMVSSFDFDEILQRAVTEAAGALGCSRALLAVPAGEAWAVRFALGAEEPARGTLIVGAIARQFSALSPGQRAIVATPRVRGSVTSPGQRSPERVHAALTVRDEVVGVISFGDCQLLGRFGESELDFIDKLAPALSLALENARLFSIHQKVAETFQRSLLRPIAPVAGFEVGLAYVPAFEPEKVGGDFYDLFAVDGGSTAVIVGDVVGKGVEAAVLTETVRTMLRTLAFMGQSPSLILAKANDLFCRDDSGRQFVTVLVAIIDATKSTVTISSAGHPPPVVFGRAPHTLEVRPAAPLGAGRGPFHEATFDLESDETLVLYTDGLTEARHGHELFGEQRVLEEFATAKGKAVQETVDSVVSSATKFAGGHLADDLIVIAVRPDHARGGR